LPVDYREFLRRRATLTDPHAASRND